MSDGRRVGGRRAAGLVAAALAMVVAALTGGAACNQGRASRAAAVRGEQARTLAREAGLAGPVQDLLARAASAVGARFAVHYELGDGGQAVLVQDPPRRRIDIVSGPVTRSRIENGAGAFSCLLADAKWTCQKASGPAPTIGAFSPGDVERTVDGLAAARTAYTFRVTSRPLVGVTARCLVTERRPGLPPDPTRAPVGELCVSDRGAPLLVRTGQSTLQATSYSTRPDDRQFTLPAPVARSG